MKTPEGKIKDQVKAFLKRPEVWYFMPVPTGYGTPTLDFVGCYKGRMFAIETKAPGKKPTPRQRFTMEEMRKGGAAVFVFDGTNEPEFKLWFLTQVVDKGIVGL